MGKLDGKIAVVTGGSRDIGRSIAIKLAKEGAKVVVNYYNTENGALETVDQIKSFGGQAIAVKADVSNLKDIKKLKNETVSAFGDRIHILVNNAGGLFARKTLQEFDEDFYQLVMGVNFKSTVFVSQIFAAMFEPLTDLLRVFRGLQARVPFSPIVAHCLHELLSLSVRFSVTAWA